LAGFINQTMRALDEACQMNGLSLASDTLATILTRGQLEGIDDYFFRVEDNWLDVDDFAGYCRQMLDGTSRGAIGGAKAFYERAMDVLVRALDAAFHAINARIASPLERAQNQEAWEALFSTFRGEAPENA